MHNLEDITERKRIEAEREQIAGCRTRGAKVA